MKSKDLTGWLQDISDAANELLSDVLDRRIDEEDIPAGHKEDLMALGVDLLSAIRAAREEAADIAAEREAERNGYRDPNDEHRHSAYERL